MRQGIKKIKSFKEAEEDTLKMYSEMTSAERLKKGFELEVFAKKISGFKFTDKDKEGFILEC